MKSFNSVMDAVKDSGTTTLFVKKQINKANTYLYPNENILAAVTCSITGGHIGVLVFTDKRVFSYTALMGEDHFLEIQINDIRNFKTEKLDGRLTIFGNHINIEAAGFRWSVIEYLKNVLAEIMTVYKGNNNAVITMKTNEKKIDKEALIDLKELLDSGIITVDEFEAKKKQILNL